jgi:chromosome segregation ATPase
MDKDQIINEFRAALDEKLGNQDFSEESVASISKVFIEAIREKGEQYVADLEKAKAEKEEAVQAQNSLQEKMNEVENQLNATKEKLSALEEENSAREAEVRFNARMEALNEVYELDEEDSKIVASELSDLDSTDDSFAAYQEKLAKIWKHKNKEVIAAEQKAFEDKVAQEVQKRLSEAQADTEETSEEVVEVSEASSTEETDETDEVSEALENLEVEEAAVINNNESSSEGDSLKERFAKTFKQSVKISY